MEESESVNYFQGEVQYFLKSIKFICLFICSQELFLLQQQVFEMSIQCKFHAQETHPLGVEQIQDPQKLLSDELTQHSVSQSQSPSKKNHGYVLKQNKDQANASRTARITLISLILEENNKKELGKILSKLNLPLRELKSRVRNMGDKQFSKELLYQIQLKQFFSEAFEIICEKREKEVGKVLRGNKNSSLPMKDRVNLIMKNMLKFKKLFLAYYGQQQHLKPQIQKQQEYETQEQNNPLQLKQEPQETKFNVLCPQALNPYYYMLYMKSRGILSPLY